MRSPLVSLGSCGALSVLTLACALPPEMREAAPASNAVAELPPPGFGTLRQDEISIPLRDGTLRIIVTPLEESVTRVTAPDTYARLSGLAEARRAEAGGEGVTLFLVSFFSDRPQTRFVPEEVQLISRGVRVRPTAILPVTPGWGQRRLRQRETEMAVYGFTGPVDLESDLTLVYGLERTQAWTTILPRVQAERARARARARPGPGNHPSRSYFAILR
jgi:hypothetical protein